MPAIVVGSVITDGEAGALLVVKFDVPCNCTRKLLPGAALFQIEVYNQFFLYPAVQRLIDRIVGGFAGPRHGTYDVRILNQFIVCHRCIDATLVGVEHCRLLAVLQEVHHISQTVYILLSRAPSFCHLMGDYLLREHVKVERHLKVENPVFEGGHVRDYHLPRTVHRLPGGVDQVRKLVPLPAWPVVHPVSGFGLNVEIPEALVGVVVTYLYMHVDPDKGGCPAISVCAVLLVSLANLLYHLLTIYVTPGGSPVLPLVVA